MFRHSTAHMLGNYLHINVSLRAYFSHFMLLVIYESLLLRCYYVCIYCVIGEAMERCYGGCLCYGPPTEGGFYYDMFYDQGSVIDSFITIRFICQVV